MSPTPSWLTSTARGGRVVLALSLDALLLLVIAPAVVLRGVLGAYSAASSCEGVGCEGPLMLLLLVVVPVVWLVLFGGYVLLSRRWGRTPAMALLRVPRSPLTARGTLVNA